MVMLAPLLRMGRLPKLDIYREKNLLFSIEDKKIGSHEIRYDLTWMSV